MAVTKKSDGNSKKTVEEGAEPSCRETTDSVPYKLIQLRKSDGAGDVRKDACGKSKSYRPRRNRNKDYSRSLSDIDDAEISIYLNTKAEINLKRILWEAMNGTCTKAKKQKRITETKTVKKDAKTYEKSVVRGQSSKINYDAYKLLNDELDSETAEIIRADSCVNSQHGSICHGSSKSSDREDEHDDDDYFDFL
ncbi:hypothetical protein ACS0TY_012069 [Phlomoides rotata]